MNFLRRELAPVSQQGWDEIDGMARSVLGARLCGRKIVDVDGPHGLDRACVSLGRLSEAQSVAGSNVRFGIHQVMPLVETRIPFSLKTWELDNLERGARDIDLSPVVRAAGEMAAFEDCAVFEGLKSAGIQGLQQVAEGQSVRLARDADGILEAVAEAQGRLLASGVTGAATLVVCEAVWKTLSHSVPGGTLRAVVEKLIGGKVLCSPCVKDALLVASRGGDAVLTLGQDFSIGYQGQTATEVQLFLTESFTFRVVAPEALVGFSLGKK